LKIVFVWNFLFTVFIPKKEQYLLLLSLKMYFWA